MFNCWPLATVPRVDYHPSRSHRRRFGADRENGRKHAACDLIAPRGTEIYAVADGTVEEVLANYYHGTSSIAIRHMGLRGVVVRYCEVDPPSATWARRGMQVKCGQVIARVGRMFTSSMLHFELYSAQARAPYTDRANKPYQRAAGLLNPTAPGSAAQVSLPLPHRQRSIAD